MSDAIIDADNCEKDYVLLNNDIEPDNELFQTNNLEQPLTQTEIWLVSTASMATCLAPTDLKARIRTLPHIIDTFHKNFQNLKNEAKNDPNRIQNEIFELYNSFFMLAKSIIQRMSDIEPIIKSSENILKELATETNRKSLIDELFKNGHKFKSIFEDIENPSETQIVQNKLNPERTEQEFIDRVEKLKAEFSVMHPSPVNSFNISEWVKFAHLFKVGTKFILPLWHISYFLFFGVAFGASLVGLTEYFSYYKNHNGFVFLNACLSELYALQEISIVMSSFARSVVASRNSVDESVLKDALVQWEPNESGQIDLILNSTNKHVKEMLLVIQKLKEIKLDTYLM